MKRAVAVGILFLACGCGPALAQARPAAPEMTDPGPKFKGAKPLALAAEHIDGTIFRNPRGIYYDAAHDEIFVADTGNGLIGIFTGEGVPKFTFSAGPSTDSPSAVTTDDEGNIYVLTTARGEVAVFNFRGEPLRRIVPGEIERIRPLATGMVKGPDGRLYLLDGVGGRILAYDLDGTLARVVHGSGRSGGLLRSPAGLAFDKAGNMYVSDRTGTPVQVFDRGGSFLRAWGKREMGIQHFSSPGGIAVDEDGRVYVTDSIRQDVKVFDAEGEFLGRFGGFGQDPGQLAYPTDIAAGPGHRLFVLERVGRRFQALGTF